MRLRKPIFGAWYSVALTLKNYHAQHRIETASRLNDGGDAIGKSGKEPERNAVEPA
jgi:hypothetical protein